MDEDKEWSMKDTEANKNLSDIDNIPGNTKIQRLPEQEVAETKAKPEKRK